MTVMQSARQPAPLLPNPRQISQGASTFVNPSHTQAPQAGPSNLLTSAPLKKRTVKRKRTDNTADESTDSASQKAKNKDHPKRKKANRACFHCQKAHLTCDDCGYTIISIVKCSKNSLKLVHANAVSNEGLPTARRGTERRQNTFSMRRSSVCRVLGSVVKSRLTKPHRATEKQ
jgi:hypothetical protein